MVMEFLNNNTKYKIKNDTSYSVLEYFKDHIYIYYDDFYDLGIFINSNDEFMFHFRNNTSKSD